MLARMKELADEAQLSLDLWVRKMQKVRTDYPSVDWLEMNLVALLFPARLRPIQYVWF